MTVFYGTNSRILSSGVRLLSCLQRVGLLQTVRKILAVIAGKSNKSEIRVTEKKVPIVALPLKDLKQIKGIETKQLIVTVEQLTRFAKKTNYPRYYYHSSRRPNYLLWHFVGLALAELKSGERVVDVGAQAGIWTRLAKRCTNCDGLDLDMEYKKGIHGRRIGSGADAIPLDDASVSAFVTFCAFNCFEGKTDTKFIQEVARCLKPDGRCVIVPFCLGTAHVNIFDPALCKREESFDEGARRHPYSKWGNIFGRWYDSNAMQQRLLVYLPSWNITFVEIDHQIPGVIWPGTMYALVCRKPL